MACTQSQNRGLGCSPIAVVQPGVITQSPGVFYVTSSGGASPVIQAPGSPVQSTGAPPSSLTSQTSATVTTSGGYSASATVPGGPPSTGGSSSSSGTGTPTGEQLFHLRLTLHTFGLHCCNCCAQEWHASLICFSMGCSSRIGVWKKECFEIFIGSAY